MGSHMTREFKKRSVKFKLISENLFVFESKEILPKKTEKSAIFYFNFFGHLTFVQYKTIIIKVRRFNNIFSWIFKILQRSKNFGDNFL